MFLWRLEAFQSSEGTPYDGLYGGGRNRIGRREKWPKQSWEGERGGKSREGEKEKLTFREGGRNWLKK